MGGKSGEFVTDYLAGKPEAVTRVDRWIASAAQPFHSRLSAHWEDLLQDIRLEVFREVQEGQFRGDASLKTYVWRVVNHSCVDRIRTEQRWRWCQLEDADKIRAGSADEFGGLSESLDTTELLLRVLSQVPQDCRDLWRMIVEGYSYREMSQELGIRGGALRVRVLRCRKDALRLRDEISARGAN